MYKGARLAKKDLAEPRGGIKRGRGCNVIFISIIIGIMLILPDEKARPGGKKWKNFLEKTPKNAFENIALAPLWMVTWPECKKWADSGPLPGDSGRLKLAKPVENSAAQGR